MSTASRLGYDGEKPVVDFLNFHDHDRPNFSPYYRPRAGHPQDVGDIAGVPYCISCKNWGSERPAQWTRELYFMCAHAQKETGIVSWKRRGKADPANWFVLTTWELFLPFHDAYLDAKLRS